MSASWQRMHSKDNSAAGARVSCQQTEAMNAHSTTSTSVSAVEEWAAQVEAFQNEANELKDTWEDRQRSFR